MLVAGPQLKKRSTAPEITERRGKSLLDRRCSLLVLRGMCWWNSEVGSKIPPSTLHALSKAPWSMGTTREEDECPFVIRLHYTNKMMGFCRNN